MSDLVVLVPVLGRPHRVTPFLDALEETTPDCRVLFLADLEDQDEVAAILAQPHRNLQIDVDTGGGCYPAKINRGVLMTGEPWIFTAADDLEPQEFWFQEAWATLHADGTEVAGLNDLIERRRRRAEHATHFLMSREYAERPTIDGRPGPFFAGYLHWKCDDELIATAKARGAYSYARDAVVKHLHPLAGLAEDDDTYRKGRQHQQADIELFHEREALWA